MQALMGDLDYFRQSNWKITNTITCDRILLAYHFWPMGGTVTVVWSVWRGKVCVNMPKQWIS